MERLPYIDEHTATIHASPERAWSALLSVLRANLGNRSPTLLVKALGVEHTTKRGEWRDDIRVGDALPGFTVADVRALEYLALRGSHRFSRYALTFELKAHPAGSVDAHPVRPVDAHPAGSSLCARTWAAFPGLSGSAYRALVIGSGAHRVLVKHLLRDVARRVGA